MHCSKKELIDFVKAWLAISIAFAVALTGFRSLYSADFLATAAIAALTVGTGFLLHEISHKIVAQKYGYWSEFRSFDQMLLLALAMSFFGFVFAAPGGVIIRGQVSRKENGLISMAGPLSNIGVALLFMLIAAAAAGTLRVITGYGAAINSWLAVFNMLPFAGFDGKKVLEWSRAAYAVILFAAVTLLVVQQIVL